GGFAINFDFCLLVAIWPSLVSTTASRAATDTSPTIGQGNGRGGPAVRWRPSGPPHTLLSALKSSEMSSNLMAFWAKQPRLRTFLPLGHRCTHWVLVARN